MEEPIEVKPDDMQFDVSRPRFSWTQNSEEYDVQGGRDEQEESEQGGYAVAHAGSPEGDRRKRRQRRRFASGSRPSTNRLVRRTGWRSFIRATTGQPIRPEVWRSPAHQRKVCERRIAFCYGWLAQSIATERMRSQPHAVDHSGIRNQQVSGSNPLVGSIVQLHTRTVEGLRSPLQTDCKHADWATTLRSGPERAGTGSADDRASASPTTAR